MWIVIKTVLNVGSTPIIGVAVGPFDSEIAAKAYVDTAMIGSLGYENWIIKELEKANF